MYNQIEVLEENSPIVIKLGVDIGNSFVNVCGEMDYYRVFDSCLEENYGAEFEEGDNTITYKDRNYTVSQGNLTAESAPRRDLNNYEILGLFAICKYIKDRDINTSKRDVIVHMCIGLPTADYNQNKDTYRALFDKKDIECIFESQKIKFRIDETRVVPQGTVVAYIYRDIFKNVSLGYLIDWGSFTVDVQCIRNGEIVKNEKRSYEVGVMRMLSEIGDVMKRLGAGFTSLKDIERALIDGKFITESGIVGIDNEQIQSVIRKRLKTITDTMKLEMGGLRSSNKTFVIGGGAIVFGEILKELFVSCEPAQDAEKLNSKAYYTFIGGR